MCERKEGWDSHQFQVSFVYEWRKILWFSQKCPVCIVNQQCLRWFKMIEHYYRNSAIGLFVGIVICLICILSIIVYISFEQQQKNEYKEKIIGIVDIFMYSCLLIASIVGAWQWVYFIWYKQFSYLWNQTSKLMKVRKINKKSSLRLLRTRPHTVTQKINIIFPTIFRSISGSVFSLFSPNKNKTTSWRISDVLHTNLKKVRCATLGKMFFLLN